MGLLKCKLDKNLLRWVKKTSFGFLNNQKTVQNPKIKIFNYVIRNKNKNNINNITAKSFDQ